MGSQLELLLGVFQPSNSLKRWGLDWTWTMRLGTFSLRRVFFETSLLMKTGDNMADLKSVLFTLPKRRGGYGSPYETVGVGLSKEQLRWVSKIPREPRGLLCSAQTSPRIVQNLDGEKL